MKKYLLLSVLVLFVYGCMGNSIQGSGNVVEENRALTNFSKVVFTGVGNVGIIQGTNLSLKVRTDDNLISHIKSVVADDTLRIYIDANILYATELTFLIEISNIALIDYRGSASLNGSNTIQSGYLKVLCKNVGDVNLDLNVTNLEVKTEGKGDVNLNGWAMTNRVVISDDGDYNGFDLRSSVVYALSYDYGYCRVYASNYLSVGIYSNGNIEYKGNPSTIDEHKYGSGNLINMN